MGDPGVGSDPLGLPQVGTGFPAVKVHVFGDRVRLQKPGTAQTLDLRADGGALDIESENADLYINNNRPVRIRNLVQGSSREWKEDIDALGADEAGRLLADLEPQSFCFRDDPDRRRHLGFVAQDLPTPIATPEREGFNPTAVIAVLTRVVKEQQQAITALRGELTALRADLGGCPSVPTG